MNLDSLLNVRPMRPDFPITPRPWLIEGLWMAGRINGVFGPEKAGKSRLVNWLLASVLAKRSKDLSATIHQDRAPAKWLYLMGEEPEEDVTPRLISYLRQMGNELPANIVFIADAAGIALDRYERRADLERILTIGSYEGLIIDPLRRVHDADENKGLSPLITGLRQLTTKLGLTTIFIHHTGKPSETVGPERIASWSRGSSDLASIVDTALYVTRVKTTERAQLHIARAGRFPDMPILLVDDLGEPNEGGRGFVHAAGGRLKT